MRLWLEHENPKTIIGLWNGHNSYCRHDLGLRVGKNVENLGECLDKR